MRNNLHIMYSLEVHSLMSDSKCMQSCYHHYSQNKSIAIIPFPHPLPLSGNTDLSVTVTY